jgi:endonuclease/exonuclease/phosphatase family metal-dependent hydrolase
MRFADVAGLLVFHVAMHRRIGLAVAACAVAVAGSATGQPPPGMKGTPLVEPATLSIQQDAPAPASADTVRVGFYNIEMFTDGIKDGKTRSETAARNQAKGAAAIVDELAADILMISEVENERALGWLNEGLATPYPYGYTVEFGTQSGRAEKMNIALLSRVQAESVHEIDFGPMTGAHRPTRGLLRAVIPLDDTGHWLLLYGAHLKANWGERERNYAQRVNGLKLLQDDMNTVLAAYPDRKWEVVVVGDFNTDPLLKQFEDDPTLKGMEDFVDLFSLHHDVSDLYTVPTRRGDPMREFPPALFDRVLVRPEVRATPWQASLPGVIMKGTETEDVTVLPGQGKHVSDHFPIYVDLVR